VGELADFRNEAELAGHMVATRTSLLATVFVCGPGTPEVSFALERLRALDRASASDGTIGFRSAFAECCDALAVGARDRLEALRLEVGRVSFRSRPWIPVECFLESVGLPLPATPTQWLEPHEVVSRRWADHLRSYLARRALR
jgi:hypothetical protein